jgi:hypothetical protein
MGHGAGTRAAVVAFAAGSVLRLTASAAPQSTPDVATLLTAVADRVAGYYQRAASVICTETATVQPIDTNWATQGFARTVESELHVELDAASGPGLPDARVVRAVRRVNGRPPRESDQKSRHGCTDPNPLSPEPLSFLLPPRRDAYRFTSVRSGRERNRPALVIDFMSVDRTSRAELIEDERGHDDCFDWKGPVAARGQVWVDAESYDVLRIDRRLPGPIDVRVPTPLQRRYNFGFYIVLDRDDVTLRFRPVAFSDPAEVLLLPEEITAITMVRNGLQSARRTETFSGYRRFLTAGRVKGQ